MNKIAEIFKRWRGEPVIPGVRGMLALLIYGTGMRLREAASLRIEVVHFSRKRIIVRQGKAGKDRGGYNTQPFG